MATPGPTFWQQIEANERARHAEDRRRAEAFIAKRFVPLLERINVKHVVDVTRGDTNNWSVGEIVCNHAKMLRASCVVCLLYTSPSPRDQRGSRMPSSA